MKLRYQLSQNLQNNCLISF